MLRGDLERIISDKLNGFTTRQLRDKWFIGVILAEAIIDRLEIDKDELKEIVFDYAYENPRQYFLDDKELVRIIIKAKPIKLKESDK